MESTDGGRRRILELLKKANGRDESAARELLKLFGPRMTWMLKQKFHLNPEDSQDVFQDSLMVYILEPQLYDPLMGEFQPLLAKTAWYRAIDHIRRKNSVKKRFCNDPMAIKNTSSPVVPFFDLLAIREESREIRDKLTKMKDSCNSLQCDIIDTFLNDDHDGDWAKRLGKKHGYTGNYVSVCARRLWETVRRK